MQGKFFLIIHHLELVRVSSTSLIDAAFIKLTSDNDERTERTGKLKFAPLQSQGKKEEQCQKEKERRRADRRTMLSILVSTREGIGFKQTSELMAKRKDSACLTHPRRLLKRTIMPPSKQDVQHPN